MINRITNAIYNKIYGRKDAEIAGDSHVLLWAGGCLAGFFLALTAFKFYIDNPEHGENK